MNTPMNIVAALVACGGGYLAYDALAYPANAAGPFEKVDAFYYPDKNNLSKAVAGHGFATVEQCRAFVHAQANAHNDQMTRRGDYECGIGKMQDLGDGLTMYRLTVR